jgi:hypothetical protein
MGKWLPYNQDGSVHECKSKGGKNSVSNNGNGNDLSLEVVLRKLESGQEVCGECGERSK